MPELHDPFKKSVAESVASQLEALHGEALQAQPVTLADIAALLAIPPEFQLGQAALPCFTFAKKLRSAPPKIAAELAAGINGQPRLLIEKTEAHNGYINFHCDMPTYVRELTRAVESGSYFTRKLLSPSETETVSIEYSQPNTHKALHVGHMRNMVYGSAICNLLAYAGHKVIAATYPGDLGAHIAKALWYIQTQKGGALPDHDHADWLGRIYCESEEYVRSQDGSPEVAARIKSEIGVVLKALQEKQGPYYTLYQTTREWSLQEMRSVYAWLGIHFDQWYFETECDEPSRLLVVKKYEEGFFAKSEGAVGIDLSDYNLGFALLLKSDGNGLYLTKDLELIRRKFEDPAVTRSIVIIDTRQKLHFQQLYKIAELLGYPQAAKSLALLYETVTTQEGAPFSSRDLNGVQLHTLRRMMEAKVVKDYLEQYRGQWSDEEIRTTAEQVTLGALKYGFLRVDTSTVIRFDLEEWLKLEGDTGPYLQYVHARCVSLLEKVGRPEADFKVVFEHAFEKELGFFLGRFNDHALVAAQTYRPSVVAAYLYDLCKAFNRFYKECPIKTAAGDLRNSRLALVECTAEVLRKGLELLGIPAPQRM